MNGYGIYFVRGQKKMNRKFIAELFGVLIFFMGALMVVQTIGNNASDMQGLMDGAVMSRIPVSETVLGAGLGFLVCGLGLYVYIKKE